MHVHVLKPVFIVVLKFEGAAELTTRGQQSDSWQYVRSFVFSFLFVTFIFQLINSGGACCICFFFCTQNDFLDKRWSQGLPIAINLWRFSSNFPSDRENSMNENHGSQQETKNKLALHLFLLLFRTAVVSQIQTPCLFVLYVHTVSEK